MPQLFTISEDWSEQFWFSTGGTRAKKYLLAPDGKYYYFKRSQYKDPTETKPGKDFTFEFWNEIIAYELGTMLGFEMLRYDLAIDGPIMGCISESMINSEKEELVEGVKYLQAYSTDYDPAKKEYQTRYTFDLIKRALQMARIGSFIDDIIKIILFDSIIGNGDRHQENWAIITHQKLILDHYEKAENLENLKSWQKKIVKWVKVNLKQVHESYEKNKQSLPKYFYEEERKFAPIYDSGSSLGRELTDEKVKHYLNSENDLDRYIDKGVSEIHWQGNKLNHFGLITKLNETIHSSVLQKYINQIIARFNPQHLVAIINTIDEKVPLSHQQYKIPLMRKELIIKIITLRFQKLRQLSNERIR